MAKVLIKNIQLASYRNLASQTIELGKGLNLFVGDNGQGKTNFLEALYVLATLRSFRPAATRELIQHGCEQARVKGVVHHAGVPLELRVLLEPGGKRLWLGGNPVHSVQDYLGKLEVVAFTPDDLSMIKGGPSVRRRFLDRAAFLFTHGHLQNLRAFNTALQSRNSLLRTPSPLKTEVVDSFSQTLAQAGHRVSKARRDLLESLSGVAGEILYGIAGDATAMELKFQPGWRMDENRGQQALYDQLQEGLSEDRARGHTRRGPQKDDFDVLLGGKSARKFGSQGQQRACALALLLAIVEVYVSAGHESPVILLDDVSSELDASSRQHLFERVIGSAEDDSGCVRQVLITTTEQHLVEGLDGRIDRCFCVQGGKITLDTSVGSTGVRG